MDMKPSLLKYLQSGWSIDTSIAVDYTLSNLPVSHLKSLHRQDLWRKNDMNLYEKAIFEVGMVIEPLTADQMFTMFGFGGFPEYLPNLENLEQKKLLRCWNLIKEPNPSDSDEY